MSRPVPFTVVTRAATVIGSAALAGIGLSPASLAAPTGVPEAVDYVVGQLVDGDHVESGGFAQHGQTVDVALGLDATDGAPGTLAAVTAYLSSAETVGAYTQGVPFDVPDAAYAGPTGKLGLALTLQGVDPTDVAGTDLVDQLLSLEQPSGQFADRSDYGDNSTLLGQALDVLFLTAADDVEPSAAAVQYLVDAQCDDGGFPEDVEAGVCESSPDATGLVIQALNADDPDEGVSTPSPAQAAALTRAVDWLEASRDTDGAWLAFGQPNVNATAYAAMGLLGAGQSADLSIDWMAGLQLPDGGLPITPADTESDLYATAQALAPLDGRSFLDIDDAVVTQLTTVPDGPGPTPTATPPVTPTATPPATPTITPTGPPTGSPTGSPTPPSPTVPGTGTPTGSDTPAATGTPSGPSTPTATSNLPTTGGDSGTLALAGLGLLVLGAGVVVAARRLAART